MNNTERAREPDLQRALREKQEGFAAAANMIGRLLDSWQEQAARIRELEARVETGPQSEWTRDLLQRLRDAVDIDTGEAPSPLAIEAAEAIESYWRGKEWNYARAERAEARAATLEKALRDATDYLRGGSIVGRPADGQSPLDMLADRCDAALSGRSEP